MVAREFYFCKDCGCSVLGLRCACWSQFGDEGPIIGRRALAGELNVVNSEWVRLSEVGNRRPEPSWDRWPTYNFLVYARISASSSEAETSRIPMDAIFDEGVDTAAGLPPKAVDTIIVW